MTSVVRAALRRVPRSWRCALCSSTRGPASPSPPTPVTVSYRLTARGVELLRSLQPMASYARRWEPVLGEEDVPDQDAGR
jgi:hypothetical protein